MIVYLSVHSCSKVTLGELKEFPAVKHGKTFYTSEITIEDNDNNLVKMTLHFDKRPPFYMEGPILDSNQEIDK